ncbi:acyltransferase family protein [Paucibacter sp. AS339]|uniref:acyltransferase family protein n=1 Tax=Paucibacter hankyongi TaxID=3133434 RepID=UPI003095C72E
MDFCRVVGAVIVVIAHLTHFGIAKGPWSEFLPQSGRDAVVVFFFLSGLVIYHSASKLRTSLAEYAVARATRIYSVALPTILLTVAVDLVGIQFHPENYPLYQYAKFYVYIPFHLAFLGEIWKISEQPFTNPPYWSLGYEVWYFVIFSVLYFYTGLRRFLLAGLLLLVVGYKLWTLFPIWLSGIALLKLINHHTVSQPIAKLLFFLHWRFTQLSNGFNLTSFYSHSDRNFGQPKNCHSAVHQNFYPTMSFAP